LDILSDPLTLLPLIAALVAAGTAIGFLAGLFGVGGGAISVPVFFEIFGALGYSSDVAMPVSVGTSLAVIVPTSISSALGHHKKGTLDLAVLRSWALPILIGVILGATIASFSMPAVFQSVFILVALVIGTKLLSGGKGWKLRKMLPGALGMRFGGITIGLVSAIMGIGGGAVSNLFLTLHGVPIHRAISTSAGVGALIAIPGTIGYVLAGLGRTDLPPGSLGFVSVFAFALTIPTSLLTTRLGVALAHRTPRRSLEIAFGSFLILVAARFILAVLSN
jgi:uncharacterized membrane protein YfcA